MNKKKLLLLISTSTLVASLGVIIPTVSGGNNTDAAYGTTECAAGDHVGNHYLANAPTCNAAGNSEFWACCNCLHQYITNPGGDWTDCGAYAGAALATTHVAYVAPTGAHDYKYTTRDSATEGDVEIVKACSECGTVEGEAVASMTKKAGATFVTDEDVRSNPFTYDETTGKYTSAVIGNSATSYIVVDVKSNGTLIVNYDISSESSDKFYIGTKDNSKKYYADDTRTYSNYELTGSVTIDAKAGDKIIMYYDKDSSTTKGRDNVIISFGECSFTYNAATFNTNGGTEITPMFIENGKVVGDIAETTKANSYFDGWFVDSTLDTPYTASTVLSGDSTLYAKWVGEKFINYYMNDGTTNKTSVSFKPGTTPGSIDDPVREDYYFLGWYIDAAGTSAYTPAVANDNVDVYAKWLLKTDAHELYGSYGGFKFKPGKTDAPSVAYPQLTVDDTGAYSLRTAYNSFETGTLGSVTGGVVAASNNGNAYVFDSGNIVVMHEKATYSTSNYLYVMVKGSGDSKMGTTSSSVKSFDKITFVSFTYKTETKIIMVDNTNGQVYYDVAILNSNDAAVDYSKVNKVSHDGMYFVVKQGATVVGEYGFGESAGKLVTTLTGVKGTFTSADSKKITFNGNGKAFFESVSTSGAADVTAKGENVYTVGKSTSYYTVTIDTAEKTFTYATAKASVTFNANGGQFADTTDTVVKEQAMGAWFDPRNLVGETPTKDGFTFGGWSTAGKTGAQTYNQITADTTFTAIWYKNVTVSFAETDDSAVAGCDPIVVVEGNKPATLPTPEKSGFVFMGWFKDKGFETPFTTDSVVGNTDMTVYAKWVAPVTLTVHYGAAEPLLVSCIPGVEPEFDVSKEGYAIEGYYSEPEFQNKVDLSAGISVNTTIYVKYVDLRGFVGTYVGYNAYSSTKGQEKTGSGLYASFNTVIANDLSVSGKAATGKLTNAKDGQLTVKTSSGDVYGIFAMASDGEVFIASHYQGFKSPCTLSGKDLYFGMLTGATADTSVKIIFNDGETNHWTFTCIKGTKTYTVDLDYVNSTLAVTNVVDSAE